MTTPTPAEVLAALFPDPPRVTPTTDHARNGVGCGCRPLTNPETERNQL